MERVTVFLAAGASSALSIAPTSKVTEEIFAIDGAIGRPIIATLSTLLKECYHSNSFHDMDRSDFANPTINPACNCVNFEHLVHALETIGSIARSSSAPPHMKAVEAYLTNGLRSELHGIDVSFILDRIYHIIRRIFINDSQSALSHHRMPLAVRFWERLRTQYKLDIITTNYDTVIEDIFQQFSEQLNQGFDESSVGTGPHLFNSRRLVSNEQSRLIHLHGSVRFGFPSSELLRSGAALWEDMCLYNNAENATESCRGARSPNLDQAGRECRIGPTITGMQKPAKLLGAEPYSSYYSALIKCLQENRKLVIVGYGFMDHHINSLFSRFSTWHGSNRKVVCINRGDAFGPHFLLKNVLYESQALQRLASDRLQAITPFTNGVCESHQHPWTSSSQTMQLYLDGFLSNDRQTELLGRFLDS